jgi:hypothetical protein
MAHSVRWTLRLLALIVIVLFVGGLVASRNDRVGAWWNLVRWKLVGDGEAAGNISPPGVAQETAPAGDPQASLSDAERATRSTVARNPLRSGNPEPNSSASLDVSNSKSDDGQGTGNVAKPLPTPTSTPNPMPTSASTTSASTTSLDEELTEPVSVEEFLRGDTGGERARLLGIEPPAITAVGDATTAGNVSAATNPAGSTNANSGSAKNASDLDRLEFASTEGGDAGLLKLAQQLQRDGRMPQDFRRRDRSRSPNILLVIVENLGREDIGAYGQPLIRTPFLDRLAAGGLRLTQCAGSSVGRSMERTALWYGDLSTAARLGNAKLLRLPRPDLPAELIRVGYLTMLLGECGWPRGNIAESGPRSASAGKHASWDAWAGWSDFSDARFQAFPTSIPDHEGECSVEANRDGATARFDAVLASACRNMLAPLRDRRSTESPLNAIPSMLVANVDLRWWEDSVEPGPEYQVADWTVEEKRHAAAVAALDDWLRTIYQEFDAARGRREIAVVVVGLPRWRKAKTQQRFRDAVPALDDTRPGQLWPYAPVIAAWPRHIPSGRVVNAFCGLHDILPSLLEMVGDDSPPRVGSGQSQWRVWTDEEGG